MKELLNTLYVTAQGAYAHLEGETCKVELEGETVVQVPLHHLGAITLFGNVMISPFLMGRCAAEGRSIALMDQNGRFLARVEGAVTGNVLLRRAQNLALSDPHRAAGIARSIVAGKIQNSRQSLLRGKRDAKNETDRAALTIASEMLAQLLPQLERSDEINDLRGLEGAAARAYFDVFNRLVLTSKDAFHFFRRTRRPPRDRMNALLSFNYALLQNDCTAALEGVGLDPQIGFLHALRPGRPALSLDLMEEFRPIFADRLALNLVNLKRIAADDFDVRPGQSVYLNTAGRKKVLVAYQERKKRLVTHRLLGEKVELGLVPHLQARLLARHLRGEGEVYVPFMIE